MGEYYDYRSEERVKASLAEMAILEQLQGLTRTFEDIVRELGKMVKAISEENFAGISETYRSVRSLKDQGESIKEKALEYLARAGRYLLTAEIYRETFLQMDKCIQNLDGIAHRIRLLVENGEFKAAAVVGRLLMRLISVFQNQFSSLNTAVRLLMDNPSRCYEETRRVIAFEEEMDVAYRQTTLDMYRILRNDIIALMIARDVVELIEETADIMRSLAENIRFLALYRSLRV